MKEHRAMNTTGGFNTTKNRLTTWYQWYTL